MTRPLADAAKVRRLMEAAGRRIQADTTIYLVGGATAVLHDWRKTTNDVDMKLVSEDEDAAMRILAALRDELGVNIEFASPDHFLPVRAGWADRSAFIEQIGRTTFRHFDYVAQALAKASRQVAHDSDDVAAMLRLELVTPAEAWRYYREIEPKLYRYPQVKPASLEARIAGVFGPEPG